MQLLVEEGFITEVRWTAPNHEKNYPARVNFDISDGNGRMSVSIESASQDQFRSLVNLAVKPVRIESQVSIRRYQNNQFISLVDPKIIRLKQVDPAPEPTK